MKLRSAAAVLAVLVLIAGAATWWATSNGTGSSSAGPTSPSPTDDDAAGRANVSPSPTESAVATGRPVAGCATESPTGRIPDEYWGMHVASPVGAGFPDAPIGAVNLTTSGTYWNAVETALGQYNFSLLDSIVTTSEDRNAQPMVVLGFTPSFHAQQPESPTAAATMPNEDAWRAWITAVVTRYGDRLDYQIWPEPNIISNWEGTPAQMARLTVIAGEIIHDQAPGAVVVAPATTLRLSSQRQWMSRFWASEVGGVSVANQVDAVALDPFPLQDGTPEDALALICRAKAILKRQAVDLPVWTNEINYGVPSGGTTSVTPYSVALQSAVVARTYLLHAALDVERVYWLGWFSFGSAAVELARDDVTTPAGAAYIRVHDWLAGGPRPLCQVEKGLYTCVVDKDDGVLSIFWREGGKAKVTAPEGVTRIQDLAGGSRPIEGGDVVRVGPSPVAMFEPSTR